MASSRPRAVVCTAELHRTHGGDSGLQAGLLKQRGLPRGGEHVKILGVEVSLAVRGVNHGVQELNTSTPSEGALRAQPPPPDGLLTGGLLVVELILANRRECPGVNPTEVGATAALTSQEGDSADGVAILDVRVLVLFVERPRNLGQSFARRLADTGGILLAGRQARDPA